MYVKCSSPKKVRKEALKEADTILEISSTPGSMIYKSHITKSLSQKYIFSKSFTKESELVKRLIVDAATRAESISASSGDICLSISAEMIKSKSKNISIEDLSRSVKSVSKRFEKNDFINLINYTFDKESIENKLIKELFDKVSFNYPIFLERTNRTNTFVNVTDSFNFNLPVSQDYVKQKNWLRNNVEFFVIDGFIESVGEIHHLLERASESRHPVVLFARNFSKDVENTILYNFNRGTLDIVPISVGFDENTLNILNDISICLGANLVSSLKGDLISKSTKRPGVFAERVLITSSGISISKKESSENLNAHVRYLSSKRNNSSAHEDLFKIFDRRIRSLTPGKVEIKIGTEMYYSNPRIIESIDKIMRLCKSYITSGVVYKKDFKNLPGLLESALDENFPYPAAALLIAARNSLSLSNSLNSIGCAIYEDK